MKRFMCILMCLLLTMPCIVSCSDNAADKNADDTAAETAEVTAEAGEAAAEEEIGMDADSRANVKDNLPDNLDFGGRTYATLVARPEWNDDYFKGPEEMTGEVVEDAVYNRNLTVSDRLNIKLDFLDTGSELGGDTIVSFAQNLVMAGDGTYDMYMGMQYGMTKFVTTNCLVNTYDLDYFDYTMPWWNNEYMDELSLGAGYRFFLVSDFFIDTLYQERTVFFNKNMYNNLYGDPNELYETALEGTWTIDKMTELAAGAYVDTDGNGQVDETDQLGYITHWHGSAVDAFQYAADVEFCTRDENGFIELNILSDRAVTLLEKINIIYHQIGSFENTDGRNTQDFANGTALFLGNATFGSAIELRDMEDDFGFLPYPKLDESQERYYSLVHDAVLIGGISTVSTNLDITGAVLEALSSESYRSLVPAWYETALKGKYSRDEISLQIIDMIHDSMRTSFVFAYNYSLGDAGLIFRTLVGNNSNDLASTVKKSSKAWNKNLEKLKAAFTAEE